MVAQERVIRLGCYILRDKPGSKPQSKQVALILKNATGDLSTLPKTIEQSASTIADAMALLHGGEWSVDISHDSGFVIIARDCT